LYFAAQQYHDEKSLLLSQRWSFICFLSLPHQSRLALELQGIQYQLLHSNAPAASQTYKNMHKLIKLHLMTCRCFQFCKSKQDKLFVVSWRLPTSGLHQANHNNYLPHFANIWTKQRNV